MYETPPAIALSLNSHHRHRNKSDIEMMKAAGIGVSYSRVKYITNQIASKAIHTMQQFDGVYVPPALMKNVPIRAAADNIDAKVDTPDGKNSFHATASTVFQRLDSEKEYETVCEPLDLNKCKVLSFSQIPNTVVELTPCPIKGNPKPRISPQYPDYVIAENNENIKTAELSDLIWLLARFMNSLKASAGSQPSDNSTEQIPTWRGFNSLTVCGNENVKEKDISNSLPIINAPPKDWSTLVTVLENIYKLNKIACPDNNEKVMVTFDMDLYKKAIKLEYIHSDYKNKWWLLPGPFHTSLCAIRCLGKTIEHSGIDEAWEKADLYGKTVINQIITGSHYNRAVDAHEITLQAFYDLWLEEFFKEKPFLLFELQQTTKAIQVALAIKDSNLQKQKLKTAYQNMMITVEHVNLEKQLMNFDKANENYPMYNWCRGYMRQVLNLLAFHRSIKQPNLYLYLSSLEYMSTYFFAYNRLAYAQHLLEFTARAYAAEKYEPEIWNQLLEGEFALTKNRIPFTSIGLDQAQEHENKVLKTEGGLQGIKNKPSYLLKYCLVLPELVRVLIEARATFGLKACDKVDRHHHLSPSIIKRLDVSIDKLKILTKDNNPLADKGDKLYNFMNKKILNENAKKSILERKNMGDKAKKKLLLSRD